jgi:hypothetical protein
VSQNPRSWAVDPIGAAAFTRPSDGARLPLIDGGSFDWLAQLNSNRRAAFAATGAGPQLIALRFRANQAGARA